jgi:hypothetical protein
MKRKHIHSLWCLYRLPILELWLVEWCSTFSFGFSVLLWNILFSGHFTNDLLYIKKTKTKLHGLSPRVNYTDWATAACWRSDCQLVRLGGATWSAWRIPPAVYSQFSRQEPLLFYQVAPQLYSRGWGFVAYRYHFFLCMTVNVSISNWMANLHVWGISFLGTLKNILC